jgi:hypothetical protein
MWTFLFLYKAKTRNKTEFLFYKSARMLSLRRINILYYRYIRIKKITLTVPMHNVGTVCAKENISSNNIQ